MPEEKEQFEVPEGTKRDINQRVNDAAVTGKRQRFTQRHVGAQLDHVGQSETAVPRSISARDREEGFLNSPSSTLGHDRRPRPISKWNGLDAATKVIFNDLIGPQITNSADPFLVELKAHKS
ncbi:hypothetical protein HAX54_011573 [Datura stramonium]|uniref:Uncharacterized protein n=1 Tax=Datura stramonium TaxID=4076 RepID=A0ABS8TIA2_DATST|nr:hypothetical protein [Datura stramonium]